MDIVGIGQIAIAVSDVKSAIDFYQNKLGRALLFEAGPNLTFLIAAALDC